MRTTNSVVVARTDEMKMSSGRERKREAVSKSPIDETLLAMWQRHNSSIGVYQRITEVSKQAGSLILRMSQQKYYLDPVLIIKMETSGTQFHEQKHLLTC